MREAIKVNEQTKALINSTATDKIGTVYSTVQFTYILNLASKPRHENSRVENVLSVMTQKVQEELKHGQKNIQPLFVFHRKNISFLESERVPVWVEKPDPPHGSRGLMSVSHGLPGFQKRTHGKTIRKEPFTQQQAVCDSIQRLISELACLCQVQPTYEAYGQQAQGFWELETLVVGRGHTQKVVWGLEEFSIL